MTMTMTIFKHGSDVTPGYFQILLSDEILVSTYPAFLVSHVTVRMINRSRGTTRTRAVSAVVDAG